MAFFAAAAWYIDSHIVSDEAQYISYDRLAHIGRYIRDYIGEVANLGHRPVVDKAKLDPEWAMSAVVRLDAERALRRSGSAPFGMVGLEPPNAATLSRSPAPLAVARS